MNFNFSKYVLLHLIKIINLGGGGKESHDLLKGSEDKIRNHWFRKARYLFYDTIY